MYVLINNVNGDTKQVGLLLLKCSLLKLNLFLVVLFMNLRHMMTADKVGVTR